MALRRFASQSVSMLGIRAAPQLSGHGVAAAGEYSLRAAACRAFATGMCLYVQLNVYESIAPPQNHHQTSSVVDGLKYAKSHEWVKVDGDTATVGITDFAQVGGGCVAANASWVI